MKINSLLGAAVISMWMGSCVPDTGIEEDYPYAYRWDRHVPFITDYNTFSMPFSDRFEPVPVELGEVAIREASGLGYSLRNPGHIWTHNDSGNSNMIFLIDAADGHIVSRYLLPGTVNVDWEDMEVSVGPEAGESYIYLADTGDNDERRPDYSIYRFPEPEFTEDHRDRTVTLEDFRLERIRFRFPDGSHDTEGMLVDPWTKDIFLVTKRDVVSMLYVLPFPQDTAGFSEAFKVGGFSFRQASAATASVDGRHIMIKNRQEIFYWNRTAEEVDMAELLSRTPVRAPYIGEPQGEAICFDPDLNYYTLSEEMNSTTRPVLFKYLIK